MEPQPAGQTDNSQLLDHGQLTIEEINEVTPEKWLDMFNKLNSTLTVIQQELRSIQSLKSDLINFTPDWKEATDRGIKLLEDKVEYQDLQIKMLKNVVIRQDQTIQTLQERQNSARMRELKPNIVIHGLDQTVIEEDRDKLFEVIKSFFVEKMGITTTEIPIVDAYRFGKATPKAIVAKLKFPGDKAIIYAHSKNLKGKLNSKKKGYFVKDDSTEEQDGIRREYRDLVKENEDQPEEKQLTSIKIHKGKLYVNNSIVRKKVVPPTTADILRMDQEQLESVRTFKLIKGPEHTENESEFRSYVFKAKTVQDVEKAYTKMRVKYGDATHISCGYRLENAFGPFRQEAMDDGDAGIGREILQMIKKKDQEQIGVFVVRHYGGVHLGNRRFEIVQALAKGAIQTLLKQKSKKRQMQRADSQSSIHSIESTLSLQGYNEQYATPTEGAQTEEDE